MPVSPLSSPPLPPKAVAWLAQQGILDAQQLRACGVVKTFLLFKAAGLSVTSRLLYALEAAARGQHWSDLSESDRQSLQYQLAIHPPVRLPPEAESAEHFMLRALELADIAARQGEVPVGALVVQQGVIIGEGYNQPRGLCDPSAHAEMLALRQAASAIGNYRLSGCDLYVTLEPCPMCSGAILNARIDRVIFAASEAKTGAAGSVIDLFSNTQLNPHTACFSGVQSQAAAARLSDFFLKKRQNA